ncbi:hypothetical protein SK128_007970, partial [Halocaridina rubra]
NGDTAKTFVLRGDMPFASKWCPSWSMVDALKVIFIEADDKSIFFDAAKLFVEVKKLVADIFGEY